MYRSLFVANQDMADISFDKLVVDIYDRPSGKPEDCIHPLFVQYLHQYLCPFEFHEDHLLSRLKSPHLFEKGPAMIFNKKKSVTRRT
jgi:hypothetical protein